MEMSSELLAILIVGIVLILLLIVISLCKIYKKSGVASWKALVPFYGAYVLYKIVFKNGWLAIIPGVNIIFGIILNFKLALLFGKNLFFGLGLLILPFVFYPVLAFGKSSYIYSTVSISSLNGNQDDKNSEVETKKEIVGNPMMDNLLKSNSTSNSEVMVESSSENVDIIENSKASFVTNVSFDEDVVGDQNKVVPLMVGGKKDDDSEFSNAVASVNFIPTENASVNQFKNENEGSDLDKKLFSSNQTTTPFGGLASSNGIVVSKDDIFNTTNEFSMNSIVQNISSVSDFTESQSLKQNDDVSLDFIAPVVEPTIQETPVITQPEMPTMIEVQTVSDINSIPEQNLAFETSNVPKTEIPVFQDASIISELTTTEPVNDINHQ